MEPGQLGEGEQDKAVRQPRDLELALALPCPLTGFPFLLPKPFTILPWAHHTATPGLRFLPSCRKWGEGRTP